MTQTFLNKKQLSNYLGISIGKIDNLIKNKNIGYYKIGKSVRFKVEDINDWITKYKTTFNWKIIDLNDLNFGFDYLCES